MLPGVENMELTYRKMDTGGLDLLAEMRAEVLRVANGLPEGTDMSDIRTRSYHYYDRALRDGSHVAYLVFDGEEVVGAGGVSFYQVMPTWHDPSGCKAYIMNMYTRPDHRRRGIARRTLDLLAGECRARGVDFIALEATPMGRPLYEKYGFMPMEHEMWLPEEGSVQ